MSVRCVSWTPSIHSRTDRLSSRSLSTSTFPSSSNRSVNWTRAFTTRSVTIWRSSCVVGRLYDSGFWIEISTVVDHCSLLVKSTLPTAENSRTFARAVAFLGYEKVFYYPGGIADWRDHSDYLVLSYEGFRKWYDEFCPFDDGEHYLIDVNEVEDYTGNSTHIPGGGGHIPAATLIDNKTFVKN